MPLGCKLYNAISTLGLSFFALFGSVFGGAELHSTIPYINELNISNGKAFLAAQANDLMAFDRFDTPLTFGAFSMKLHDANERGLSVLNVFDDYEGPTTRHVLWALFTDGDGKLLHNSNAMLGKGDMSDVLARDVRVPLNLEDALNDPRWAAEWRKALANEMQNMVDAEVWELVPLPPGGVDHFVDTKFVFKVKSTPSGSIDKFKVRLVGRGFTQIYGMDYFQTYAPVVRGCTFQMQMCDAVQRGLKKAQIGFTGAFLQADIDGEIYLKLDSSCGVDVPPGYCVKLKKSLYGTKQAAFLWNAALVSLLVREGFKRSVADPCMFIRDDERGYTSATVWVDDVV